MPIPVTGGVYLVLNPTVPAGVLLNKLRQALEGGVELVQVWNNWPKTFSLQKRIELIRQIKSVATDFNVPVLINQAWKMLLYTDLDGIHFDDIPADFERIKTEISKEFISGITCGNRLDVIHWADENGLDYISFCAMFPSNSVGSCEIVRPETLLLARNITQLPLFVSGGITVENVQSLKKLNKNLRIDGIAVISGILDSESPKRSAIEYKQALQNIVGES